MLIFAVKFTGFRTTQETHLCGSMTVFLGRVTWGKLTSMWACSGAPDKNEGIAGRSGGHLVFVSLWFLTMDEMWPAVSHPCHYAFFILRDWILKPGAKSKSLRIVLFLSLVRCFIVTQR